MYAFSRQFPIQAVDITRMLVARGAKHTIIRRPVRRGKQQKYRTRPIGSHKQLAHSLHTPNTEQQSLMPKPTGKHKQFIRSSGMTNPELQQLIAKPKCPEHPSQSSMFNLVLEKLFSCGR